MVWVNVEHIDLASRAQTDEACDLAIDIGDPCRNCCAPFGPGELGEKRKDAQLAREIEFSISREMNQAQGVELARDSVQAEFVDRGMVADLTVHWDVRPDRLAKPHAHVMLSMREVTRDGAGQIMALNWVKRTIGAFGGDPEPRRGRRGIVDARSTGATRGVGAASRGWSGAWGVRLLHRTTRPVRPTSEGEPTISAASRSLRSWRRLTETRAVRSPACCGSTPSAIWCGPRYCPPCLRSWRATSRSPFISARASGSSISCARASTASLGQARCPTATWSCARWAC